MEDDWFQKKEIKKLRSIAGGDTYVIIYLKIILLSLRTGGRLYFEGIDENFAAEIALEIDENKDNVLITLEFLLKHSSVIQVDDHEFHVSEISGLIGSETSSAIRVRKCRERKKVALQCNEKPLQCNSAVTPVKQNGNGEKELELEIELEKELETEAGENEADLFQTILASFHAGHKELTGTDNLGDYKIQGRQIKNLIKRCMDESGNKPEAARRMCGLMIRTYFDLIKTGGKFWRDQPFVPSALLSTGIWDRVRDRLLKSQKHDDDYFKKDEQGRHYNIFTRQWEL